ncbi:NAD(P)-binding protein, partial [Clavulina sp. PMI_390]
EGPWALVTGSSDGIGRGLAEELLSRGCNVILHGRNSSKLHSLKESLALTYPSAKTDIFVYDAADLDTDVGAPSFHTTVASLLVGRRLTILINNVGYTSSYAEVEQQDPAEIDAVLNVGMRFMTHLTRACLPYLSALSEEEHAPALIINVTGLTARYPAPLLSVHSGTKAYVEAFSRALSIELDMVVEPKKDVKCIAVDVHNVASNSNPAATSFLTPTARTEAAAILNVIGTSKRSVTAYWRHGVTAGLLALLPRSTMDDIMAKNLKMMR